MLSSSNQCDICASRGPCTYCGRTGGVDPIWLKKVLEIKNGATEPKKDSERSKGNGDENRDSERRENETDS